MIRSVLRTGRRRALKLTDRLLGLLGLHDAETKVIRDAEKVWNPGQGRAPRSDAHWRGEGSFQDDDLWLRVGREHLRLYEMAARAVGFERPLDVVVEWGCGGGANVVHFGPLAGTYFGVDVSRETLAECERQATSVGVNGFRPVLGTVADPEAAAGRIDRAATLFLCTYVFELVPSQAYGKRLLRIAAGLLEPGGLAIVQIKYRTGSWLTTPIRRGYGRNYAAMTTYTIDGFWETATEVGLTPQLVVLVPQHRLDPRYAYFVLLKPDANASV